MTTDAGLIEEIGSIFNVTPPDEMILMNWIGALRSGDYKFGYGLMRSGDDEYDALGVLAAISAVEWEWNADDGAWAADGEVYAPEAKVLAGWLGIRTDKAVIQAGGMEFVTRLTEILNDEGDRATSLNALADLLNRGHEAAKRAKTRHADAIGFLDDRKVIRGGYGEDRTMDIRPYYARR